MASISATSLVFFLAISCPLTFQGTVIEDLNNLHPPSDFNSIITNNCHSNPSLRYCSPSTPFDLHEIFKSTIVASHLCNISDNPNCVESFPEINLRGQPKLAPLYLSFTFFWKFCPLSILSIDLANSSLKGGIPGEIFYCSQIQQLDLSHNHLSGDVVLDKFSGLENLKSLNLSYNEFSEIKLSDRHFLERFNSSSFVHSGLLPNHKRFGIKALLLLVGFPVSVILMVVFCGWLCFWRPDFLPDFLRRKHMFTPSILEAATNGFSKRNLVENAGNVSIYRGVLRDGNQVKIEIYWDMKPGVNRRRFVQKCKILVRLRHTNVVPVMGWCDHRKFRAIITEWIDSDNIETWLLNTTPPWKQRLKVMLGVAAGVCYLHEEFPEIVYDLKSRNILLSEDGEPLITRFKVDHHRRSSSKKTYKFGVFILEMVANKRALEDSQSHDSGFVDWVKMQYPDNLESAIDKRMKKTGNVVEQAMEVIELGLMCTDLSTSRQPNWEQICNVLSNLYSMAAPGSLDHMTSRAKRGDGHTHAHHR
ncbi:probable L-type lectin-domain containing receptor kinase VII.2 [Henckelia pumila]|uniref:probable L-type lectin-domain containing receptor kinase VII.2 n=1 Tax=Henckelia pumila TaxID=405737 RepID=UPI003C6E7BDF